MTGVPNSALTGGADASGPETGGTGSGDRDRHVMDRAGLAERADVPRFVVDLVIDAGLLTPLEGEAEGERFAPDDVDMLVAARTLVGEGVAVEEMAALAMRHATNVENLIDDAIDLLKRNADRNADRAALARAVERLVPVATQLVVGHFERTLRTRAMARIGGSDTAAGAIIVAARRLRRRIDPLAVYAGAAGGQQRSVWLRPDAQMGLAGLGAVETIDPAGEDRFTRASAARAVLAARIKYHAPSDAPAPVLLGGFSFAASGAAPTAPGTGDAATGDAVIGDAATGDAGPSGGGSVAAGASRGQAVDRDEPGQGVPRRPPGWQGFGDCRLVLPELTVLDRRDGTWAMAAARVGSDGDEEAARAELERRLSDLEQRADALSDVKQRDPALSARSGASPGHAARAACADDGDGVLPVDRQASPGPAARAARAGSGEAAGPNGSLHGSGNDGDYLDLVASAVAAIGRGELHKVVLARTLTLDIDVDTVAALDLLRRRNPTCAVFAFAAGDSTFLGATPEELATLKGSRLHTTALAGTAPRGESGDADERLAAGLLVSTKNRSEHRFVVEGITAALAGLGLVDPAPSEPGVLKLSHLQHLRTPITASVQRRRTGASDMDVVRVAGVLHPTPATGGAPTAAAMDFIARHEGFDRGWYAAPVGWCDLEGNGELGVALRSALVEPGRIQLFAGAGIVADSVPADELAETSVKLGTLLDVVIGPDPTLAAEACPESPAAAPPSCRFA